MLSSLCNQTWTCQNCLWSWLPGSGERVGKAAPQGRSETLVQVQESSHHHHHQNQGLASHSLENWANLSRESPDRLSWVSPGPQEVWDPSRDSSPIFYFSPSRLEAL